MFDSIFVDCPNCGAEIEFQSKSGPCRLNRYSGSSVPVVVASGASGDTAICEGCKALTRITIPPGLPRVVMIAVPINDVGEEVSEYD